MKNIFLNILTLLKNILSKTNSGFSVINKISFVALILATFLWMFLEPIVFTLITKERIKENIKTMLESSYHGETSINGEVEVNTEFDPIIIANDITIDKKDSSRITIQKITITPQISSLILGKIGFDRISLTNVKMEYFSPISNTSGAQGFLNADFLEFFKKNNVLDNILVDIEGLTLSQARKKDNITQIIRTLFLPKFKITPVGSTIKINSTLESKNEDELFYFDADIKNSTFSGKLYSSITTGTELNVSGNITNQPTIAFDASISGKIVGFNQKLFGFLGLSDEFLETIKNDDVADFKSEISFKDNNLVVKNSSAVSDRTNLSFDITGNLSNQINLNINLNFNKLDFSKSFKDKLELSAIRKIENTENDYQKNLENFFLFSLGDDLNINFKINAPDITFYNNEKGSLKLDVGFDGHNMLLKDFRALLPGSSAMVSTATLHIDRYAKAIKGGMKLKLFGKNLMQFSKGLNLISGINENKNFGNFYFDTDVYFYEQKVHFRQIKAIINDDRFAGQIMIDYSKKLMANSAFNFYKIELDDYLPENKILSEFSSSDSFSIKLDFLRIIDSFFDNLNLTITADNLTKSGAVLNDFSLYAEIVPGITDVKNIFFNSEYFGDVKGKAKFDITKFQPNVDFDFDIERLDIDKQSGYNFDGKWGNSDISFSMLSGMDGKISLKVKTLNFLHYVFSKLRANIRLNGDGDGILEKSKAEIFGTKIDFDGNFTTNHPSFTLTLIGSDIQAAEFLRNTLGGTPVNGKFNFSGVVSSEGRKYVDIIKNLKGRFRMASKGFAVQGFNLNLLASLLPKAKSIEQIRMVLKQTLNNEQTIFGNFEGDFLINNGKISFNDIPIRGYNVRSGKSTGVIDLLSWTKNINTYFDLDAEDKYVVPLELNITGKINQPTMNWKDEGPIKYWEDKFYGGEI